MADAMPLSRKIARLVRERGWSQSEFARLAGLNRLTARRILLLPDVPLRNRTVQACAEALGLSVAELEDTPLPELLRRRTLPPPADRPGAAELATAQPALWDWLQRHPHRAARLSQEELAELASLRGVGGPLTEEGVAYFVDLLERRRELLRRAAVVANTEYLPLLEQIVQLLYEKVQVREPGQSAGRRQRPSSPDEADKPED
jgi:transcriptional regulator with XRE-family HTH domain